MPEPLLSIEDLRTYFYTDEGVIRAVDGVSLEIPKGRTLGLVGESGCGKSVTALSVIRLIPTPGRIVGGRVVLHENGRATVLSELPEPQMRKVRGGRISMIFQEPMTSLNPVFTIGSQILEAIELHQKWTADLEGARLRGNEIEGIVPGSPTERAGLQRGDRIVALQGRAVEPGGMAGALAAFEPGARIELAVERGKGRRVAVPVTLGRRRMTKRDARARAIEMLRKVRIPEPERRFREYPHQFSGGMRQRAMIAMALSCHPRLLIADEPTTALDVTIQAQILDLLRGLQREMGMSILMITHDLGIIAETADEVAVMYASKIVERAPVTGLFRRPLHPYTLGLFAARHRPGTSRGGKLKTIPGTVPSPLRFPTGCKFHPRCPFVKPDCREKEPELRQIEPGHWVRCPHAREIRERLA